MTIRPGDLVVYNGSEDISAPRVAFPLHLMKRFKPDEWHVIRDGGITDIVVAECDILADLDLGPIWDVLWYGKILAVPDIRLRVIGERSHE